MATSTIPYEHFRIKELLNVQNGSGQEIMLNLSGKYPGILLVISHAAGSATPNFYMFGMNRDWSLSGCTEIAKAEPLAGAKCTFSYTYANETLTITCGTFGGRIRALFFGYVQ